MNTIAFPKFGLEFNIDPILIHYGHGGVHWYGIIIAVAVVLALLLCSRLYRGRGGDPEVLLDLLLWVLPLGIAGARLYYVIFSWADFRDNPWSIVEIWGGGLAIYGGIIAGIITAFIFCRIKGLSFLELADVCVPGVILGQCMGRWGNFVNGEAHGGATSLPWGMTVNGGGPYHPTFLYESLWSLIGLIILIILVKKCLPRGVCFFTYAAWYGLGRFFIEGLRTDSLYVLPGVRVSQIVAAASVALGVTGIIITAVKSRRGNSTNGPEYPETAGEE